VIQELICVEARKKHVATKTLKSFLGASNQPAFAVNRANKNHSGKTVLVGSCLYKNIKGTYCFRPLAIFWYIALENTFPHEI
jgi:hypothetical protein